MEYAVERTVDVEFRGETFKCKLRMISMREKLAMIDDSGRFDKVAYFEASVPKIEGPEINGRAITCGADVLDCPGTEGIYAQLQRIVNEWDIEEVDRKN